MIIVRFQGGLGNQIFQYAMYEKLRNIYSNTEVVADLTSYKLHHPHNGFELDTIFKVSNLVCATPKQIRTVTGKWPPIGNSKLNTSHTTSARILKKLYRIINRVINRYNAYVIQRYPRYLEGIISQKYESGYVEPHSMYHLNTEQDWYFDGTWFNCDYSDIKEILWDQLIPKDVFLKNGTLKRILECNSVSIHVRRGDYASWNYLILDMDYYRKAIRYIYNKVKEPVFFVFSDEIDRVRTEFEGIPEYSQTHFIFVDENAGVTAYLDMLYMSKCKHNIIANSTFSVAADLLNKNDRKITIAPAYWMQEKKTWDNQEWILI